jgi:hypothetical protein
MSVVEPEPGGVHQNSPIVRVTGLTKPLKKREDMYINELSIVERWLSRGRSVAKIVGDGWLKKWLCLWEMGD